MLLARVHTTHKTHTSYSTHEAAYIALAENSKPVLQLCGLQRTSASPLQGAPPGQWLLRVYGGAGRGASGGASGATGADHGWEEGTARRERKGMLRAPRGHTSEPALASPMRVSMLISALRSVVETRRLPKGSRKLFESSSRPL